MYTARDSTILLLFPEREAHYSYYKHGPLMRTVLGQLQVQGLDYAYTLQGWLKGINSAMGGTLTNGTDTTEAFPCFGARVSDRFCELIILVPCKRIQLSLICLKLKSTAVRMFSTTGK